MAGLSAEDLSDLRESVGTHRPDRRLTPIEVAVMAKEWEKSQNLDQLCAEVGLKDTSVLRKLISLLSLLAAVKKRCNWGEEMMAA